jgi:hypothetical protein
MRADTTFAAIGDIAALAAAAFAFLALGQARQAAREAHRERRDAEHARLVRRVEWAGEMIEQIDRLAEDDQRIRPPADSWRRGRILLAQGFVGLADRLPRTAELVGCSDVYQVRSSAVLAREEVGRELQRLAREQGEPGSPRSARIRAVRAGRRLEHLDHQPGQHRETDRYRP